MKASAEIPDFEWYVGVSKERGVTPRCPFATVERCPRYYHSLALLGDVGSTKISPEEEARLESLWENSELLPRTAEQATTVSKSDGKLLFMSKFCPEVMYDRFGLFVKALGDYADSVDRDIVSEQLAKEGVTRDHWRWRWAWIEQLHFTECPLYSPLSHVVPKAAKVEERREDVLALKPSFMGMSLNLNELWRRLRKRPWRQ